MASPPVRRQITVLPLVPSSTPQPVSTRTTPPPTATSTTSVSSLPSRTSTSSNVSSSLSPTLSPQSSLSHSTSSLEPVSSSSSITPSLPTIPSDTPTSPPNGQVTVTEVSSSTALPSSGASGSKGKSFLENKPLSGFVFGLSGLVGLILVVIVVTSYVRRRNRKRLLADASNFSFDPKVVEDRASSEEKHSYPSHGGYHSGGHGHSDYTLDNGATSGYTGVGMGGGSRPGPPPASPMPAYTPQDYAGHDGGYPTQYYNLGNAPTGYNPTPNPYDMYGSMNGGEHLNGQDPYNPSRSSGQRFSTNPGPPIPLQLQPGVHSTRGPIIAPHLTTSPPPLNRSSPVPSPASASLQPPTYNQYNNIPRLPTPGALPDTFGPRKSDDGDDDDAYGGAFLGPDSPPEQRTLQVANM